MLDFRINTFLTVCEYMNFTKAAESLCITQPAVSQHIKFLEKSYNTKFFEYEGRKIKLTPSGELFYSTAVTMKHDEDFLKSKLMCQKNNKRSLKFGATLTIGQFILPERLNKFINSNKDIELSMVVKNTSSLLNMLNEGSIDFALVEGYFVKSEYDYEIYSEENFICVCGSSINIKDNLLLEDLLSENLIVREEGSGTRSILNKNLDEKNLSIHDFKNVIEIGNIDCIKYLIKNNNGITFIYEAAVKNELIRHELKKIDVKDLQTKHDFYFIWRKNSAFSKLYRELSKKL